MLDKGNHPYIPNSLQEIKQEMMREIGIRSIEELFSDIPEKFRLKRKLNVPEKGLSEFEVKKHVEALLSRSETCNDMPVFLGAVAGHTTCQPLSKKSLNAANFSLLTHHTSLRHRKACFRLFLNIRA